VTRPFRGLTVVVGVTAAVAVTHAAARPRSPISTTTAIAPPATVAMTKRVATPTPEPTPEVTTLDLERLRGRALAFPVAGVDPASVRDSFDDMRGSRRHEALDIPAARGVPVLAVDDGVVAKLFTSLPGGLTVYQFDRDGTYCYYYAHLDRYAEGLQEGQVLRKRDPLGYVGTTGNARETPHLHFTIFKLAPAKRWWQGTVINPHPFFVATPRPTQ
jgi:murein DD-endopeptidase MepM/ murein hydrolase activator NlpD